MHERENGEDGTTADSGRDTTSEAVLAALSSLSDRFDQRIRHDDVREKMFNALHEQLRKAESDQALERNKGLYRALLGIYDEIGRIEARQVAAVTEEGASKAVVAALEDTRALREDMIDLLERENIVRVAAAEDAVGAPFDRRVQQALGTVPTADARLDNRVARVVKDGFLYGERTLRPQQVMVWRYDAGATEGAVAAIGGKDE